jgi:predicted enzyme related to lactoylglutathione lyase
MASWSVAPVFLVDDVEATAEHYRTVLGFTYDRIWGDPPSFCMVKRGGVILMLKQLPVTGTVRPNRVVDPEGDMWDAYVWIEDADALHAELVAAGAKITRAPCDQIYGCRDFDVEDCNGYRICFGHPLW